METTTETTESFTSDSRPYAYSSVYKLLCATLNREKISDKDVGSILKVSERQVRKARLIGMDWVQADLFCTRSKVGHVTEVFGLDRWATEDVLRAAAEADKTDPYILSQKI